MARLLIAELLLLVLTALFAAVGFPWLSGRPPAWPLLSIGFLMALAFVALYALANLAARRLPEPALLIVGLLALGLIQIGPGGAGAWVSLAAGILLALLGRALGRGAGASLYAYAVPLLAVRWLLVPLAGSGEAVLSLAMQCGTIYFFARGLVRLAFPTAAEGDPSAAPLVRRPVPDRVAALVEAASRRRALPYATREDGSRDEEAISIRCSPAEAAQLADRLRAALEDHPAEVMPGVRVGDEVELVIRMKRDAPDRA